MADKVYECMFIFNANAYARNPANASEGVREIVDSINGELLASRMWNEQKLAYPINGQRKGVYWLSYVKMDGTTLPKFNRACQLNDIILRHLVINIDSRLVDPLVAAANDTKPSSPVEPPPSSEQPKETTDQPKAAETTEKSEESAETGSETVVSE